MENWEKGRGSRRREGGGENIAFGLSLFTLSVGGGVSMHELTFKTCVTRKNI